MVVNPLGTLSAIPTIRLPLLSGHLYNLSSLLNHVTIVLTITSTSWHNHGWMHSLLWNVNITQTALPVLVDDVMLACSSQTNYTLNCHQHISVRRLSASHSWVLERPLVAHGRPAPWGCRWWPSRSADHWRKGGEATAPLLESLWWKENKTI